MLHSIVRIQWISAFTCIILLLAVAFPCQAGVVKNGTQDFCQLSGFVYHDLNNDGTRGSQELFIPEVEITLNILTNGGYEYFAETTTGSTGHYCFSNIPAGIYSILESQPVKLDTAIANAVGTAGGEALDPNQFANIELASGTVAEDYNFGEWGLNIQYISKRDFIVVANVEPVPEPATLTLLGILFGGIAFYTLRRRRK